MVQEQVQAHLAEELSNWKAEQQVHEGIYLERITSLELAVSKLCTELAKACTPFSELDQGSKIHR